MHEWSLLLFGNGLSIDVWPSFEYASLLEYAGGLTEQDRALFDGTANFEHVLRQLSTAIRINGVLGLDTEPLYERYRSIQLALGQAVRAVHLDRSDVPGPALAAIRAEMLDYELVFTTSYDLLLYWAMGYGGVWRPFTDGFKYGGRCEFRPERFAPRPAQIPVYFLHGALHLVVGGTGVTWKLRHSVIERILDQFGQPMEGDPHARPLLVTEGSARDKLLVIQGNDYLNHALAELRRLELPAVIFGSSLSEQDDHLVGALNEHAARPVAISMLPGPPRQLAARQADLYGRLAVDELIFFDATTHPLGRSERA
jgi:hypothetical protein